MKLVALFVVGLIALGCTDPSDEPEQFALIDSEWKVVTTRHDYVDGTTAIFDKENDGGFYVSFKKGNHYSQTFFPYTVTVAGKWDYNTNDQLLTFFDADFNAVRHYQVLELTEHKLVLYHDNLVYGQGGYVKVTFTLSRQ